MTLHHLCIILQTQYEAEKKQAQEDFNREKGVLQDKIVQDIIERQRRHTKVEAPELRAVTRKMRTLRGEQPPAPAKGGKRETKASSSAIPLRQVRHSTPYPVGCYYVVNFVFVDLPRLAC